MHSPDSESFGFTPRASKFTARQESASHHPRLRVPSAPNDRRLWRLTVLWPPASPVRSRHNFTAGTSLKLTCLKHQAKKTLRSPSPEVYEMDSLYLTFTM